MECAPANLSILEEAFLHVTAVAKEDICSLYLTRCTSCRSRVSADWIEWNERSEKICRVSYDCPKCGTSREKKPSKEDISLAAKIMRNFSNHVNINNLWFPRTRIPPGDKTDSLLSHNVKRFDELFTRRNLIAISTLRKAIEEVNDSDARKFLNFALSGSLKWASRQSHLRGKIVEGWAIHAYWLYPRTLEMNVWNIFERRVRAVMRGKKYHSEHIGKCRSGRSYTDLRNEKADYLILHRDSSNLPLPDECVDAIVTDPPYGKNVNYGELSDFWYVWNSNGKTIDKRPEVVINKTQKKTLLDYENLLYLIFKECYRVLKQGRFLVCTFNSKDLRVVASFVMAVSRAGFTLHPQGLSYQKPIRAYATTLHAMQIGSFAGDFIFTFSKVAEKSPAVLEHYEVRQTRDHVSALVSKAVEKRLTEIVVREAAYKELIPFIAKYARIDVPTCREIVSFFESQMRQYSVQFRETRWSVTESRRKMFHRHFSS
jgi:hypothetical protein